ncbi:MAG: nitrilase-related carbon-nitrogen hydrolase [Acidobacteriota bacterium]|jgi:N-carbamoylputrescine amidase
MRLALAQVAAASDRQRNLDRALETLREAARRGAEMAVFPELAVDRFFPCRAGDEAASSLAEPVPGPTTDRVASLARELGMVVVFNLYERTSDGRFYDSSPVIDADGVLLGTTRMVHITDYTGFHEQAYYEPGDTGAPVYDTRIGRVGVAICYDRHYPEYMRALGLRGADLVVIPQAGILGEWPEGMFEAEVRTAAFQNGYFAALCNRVGTEEDRTEDGEPLVFAGESFVSDPEGKLVARGARLEEDLVLADLDLSKVHRSAARQLFLEHRRPDLYTDWLK